MSIRFQQGFNLIEVLIATVVLTIGLLGVAALQLTGMRNTQGSYFRSQATTIMNDLAERIYANTPGAANYGGFNSATNACATPAALCAMTSTTVVAGCTPAQMATYDLFIAGCSAMGANTLLTSGSLQTDCLDAAGAVAACGAGSRLRITVNWQERGATVESASAGAMETANLVTQSINLVIQP